VQRVLRLLKVESNIIIVARMLIITLAHPSFAKIPLLC
jgi:hypothetical protein